MEQTIHTNKLSYYFTLLKQAINGHEMDYTTGSLRKAVLMLAIPMMLEMCMESVFAVVDLYFVGHLKDASHAIQTVGLTESVLTIIYSLAIGMRRLSIIDIEGGHQPMFNEDGTVGVILNGEIYNFQELQQQLKDRGHTFHTRSDSEVIAHAYEEWGAGCVERLQGMFALAVWNGRGARQSAISNQQSATVRSLVEDSTLFLARDRLGIKPLYYTAISNQQSAISRFVFASEVRTLLASGVVPRKLSRAAVESYLLFGSVSEPMTLVEGIYSLPPGHHLTVAVGAPPGSLNVQRYWNIADEPARNGHANENDIKTAAKRVRNLLEQSVRSHLIADVPVPLLPFSTNA